MSLPCLFMQIWPTNVHVHTQGFAPKKSSDESLPPTLHGRSTIIVINIVQCHVSVLDKKNSNAALIFTVPDIIAKFGIMSGTVKIGFTSIFSTSPTHRWYTVCLYTQKLASIQNFGSKFPSNQNFHPNPCALKLHAKMAYVGHGHVHSVYI